MSKSVSLSNAKSSHIMFFDDTGNVTLTPSAVFTEALNDATTTSKNYCDAQLKRGSAELEGKIANVHKNAMNNRKQLSNRTSGLEQRVYNIEQREKKYMKKDTSYNMRTTNMKPSTHCLSDKGNNKHNTGKTDNAEWYNTSKGSARQRCIRMKFN